jgi:tRNA A-37 threonylcarbamoyl transferase component Bud32
MMDSDWEYVTKNFAEGKEGSVSVISINGTNAILKQFKPKKSSDRLTKEANLQMEAFELGIAPEVYTIDTRAKRIFMQGIEHRLVDTAQARNPPELTTNEEQQIICMYECLDENGIFHNDGNALNIMHHPNGQIVIIDYGMAKRITPKLRKKAPEGPNIKYGWAMLKRSLRHNGIKAWDNLVTK